MDEDEKMKIARFRFGVIHDLTGTRTLPRGDKEKIVQEKASREWDIPFSGRSHISRSTILNWVRMYEKSGKRLESLCPDTRDDKGKSRVCDDETAMMLINLKKELKGASLPVILRIAKKKNILPQNLKISDATIYRLFKRNGLMDDEKIYEDRRRFEAEFPQDIWQSDCMHGPKIIADGKLRKSYLFAFIDDASRLIPHAEFYLYERIDSYTHALMTALKKRGVPRKLYVDNGPTFRSHLLEHATASLGIALIHSKPYQPEGRGKIERWFRTVRISFLTSIPQGLSLAELNSKLSEWINTHYHTTVHSSTKETPLSRYLRFLHQVKEAPKDIEDYFRKRILRRVDKDRTVSLLNRIYEAPVELIGKTVTLLYHEKDSIRIEVFYNNKSYGFLVPLDVHVNCKVRRLHHITEIVTPGSTESSNQTKNIYKGGRLFEKGNSND